MVCFAVMTVNSNPVMADDAVELEILKKVTQIKHAVNRKVLPRLGSVPKTGQTIRYATGDDGDWQKGTCWPKPRFKDNGNGTVTDNLTGLIWLKNANCDGQKNWTDALRYCNGLADGQCGLMDGSSPGDWRLPNIRELQSLLNYKYYSPPLSNRKGDGPWEEGDAFNNVQHGTYWSSTNYAANNDYPWHLHMGNGDANTTEPKTSVDYVWPVRGPN